MTSGHGDVRGNVGDVQQPLAADRVTAERARAVEAQPDRGHADQGRPGGLAGHRRSVHDRPPRRFSPEWPAGTPLPTGSAEYSRTRQTSDNRRSPGPKISATRPYASGCITRIVGTLGIMATRVAKGTPRPGTDAPGGQGRPAAGQSRAQGGQGRGAGGQARSAGSSGRPASGRASTSKNAMPAPTRQGQSRGRPVPVRAETAGPESLRPEPLGPEPVRPGQEAARQQGPPPRHRGAAAAADGRPDPDPGRLAGPAGGRPVDGGRARGRLRRAAVREERPGPGPAAPAGRRGPGLPGGGPRRRRHHLVPPAQLRRADAVRPVPRRVRLGRLDRAPPARPAGLAVPAPPRPQRADRADGDRLELPAPGRARPGAHRGGHPAAGRRGGGHAVRRRADRLLRLGPAGGRADPVDRRAAARPDQRVRAAGDHRDAGAPGPGPARRAAGLRPADRRHRPGRGRDRRGDRGHRDRRPAAPGRPQAASGHRGRRPSPALRHAHPRRRPGREGGTGRLRPGAAAPPPADAAAARPPRTRTSPCSTRSASARPGRPEDPGRVPRPCRTRRRTAPPGRAPARTTPPRARPAASS